MQGKLGWQDALCQACTCCMGHARRFLHLRARQRQTPRRARCAPPLPAPPPAAGCTGAAWGGCVSLAAECNVEHKRGKALAPPQPGRGKRPTGGNCYSCTAAHSLPSGQACLQGGLVLLAQRMVPRAAGLPGGRGCQIGHSSGRTDHCMGTVRLEAPPKWSSANDAIQPNAHRTSAHAMLDRCPYARARNPSVPEWKRYSTMRGGRRASRPVKGVLTALRHGYGMG